MTNTYIPAGTRLTYVNEFTVSTITTDPASLLSQLSSALQNNWNITVESSDVNYADTTSWVFGNSNGAMLKVLNGSDHGGQGTDGTSDILDIIDHEFFNALGSMPTASRITDYTLPGAAMVKTGAPAPPTGPTNNQAPGGANVLGQLPELSTMVWIGLAGVFGLGILFVVLHA